jgi:ATP-dependent Lon protease
VIPKENEKDLKDIPASVAKQVEIVFAEHMDEVLPHALILNDGDTLFTESDIPFEIMSKDRDEKQHPHLQ